MARNHLFFTYDWHSVQEGQKSRIVEEIKNLDAERILGTPLEDLATYFQNKYHLEVPQLNRDLEAVEQNEIQIDVSNDPMRDWYTPGPHYVAGTQVTLEVPFTGNTELFSVRPSTYTSNPPVADVRGDKLIISISGTNLEPKKVKQELDNELGKIATYLTRLSTNADAHNSGIHALAMQVLESRKKKLLADRNLVSELGFPLKKRDESKTYAAPTVKRKILPKLPAKSEKPFSPEPALVADDYEHILEVLGNMAHVMERSPSAFESMDEEALRTHFLVHLNGHYEGNATGETFNYSGKTDILIRENGKNIFIAECKYWGGPKKLSETLDQLLSYSSWRDTKVALVVFNRRKNLTKVLESIVPTIQEHDNYKRVVEISGDTRFRFIISHKDDPSREMIVTVLVFDVPNKEITQPDDSDNVG